MYDSSFCCILYLIYISITECKSLDRSVLDAKIKNISNVISEMKENIIKKTTSTPSSQYATPIAEKVYLIPLGKIKLRKFMIDMTVGMNYLKNDSSKFKHGNLRATADVNAKLYEDKYLPGTQSRVVRKKDGKGHFEYISPMFKINMNSLPVGVQLFVPIHEAMEDERKLKENSKN